MPQHSGFKNLFQTPLGAWLSDVRRPAALAWIGLVTVALLAVVTQVMVRLPLVPSLGGVAQVTVGLLPEVAGLLLPVALFIGVVVAAHRWAESGEMLALHAAGWGGRRMLPALWLVGLLGAGAVAVFAHSLGPAGRTLARETLAGAAADLHLEAGRPIWVGDTLVRVGEVEKDNLVDLFVAQGDVVATAPRGALQRGGAILLQDGSALGLGPEPWALQYEQLSIPLHLPPPRVHAFDMSDARLLDLIERMETRGRMAEAERLVLIKRTTLALSTPLLVLLGLPLGVRIRRVGAGVVGTILGLWALQRGCDHLAVYWGAEISAGLPLLVLSAASALAWLSWRDR